MEMRERIKLIRKNAGVTQAEFAQSLGLGPYGTANWEKKDAQIPTESMQLLICKTYGINKHWLETGEGDMLDGAPDPLETLREKHKLSPVAFGIVKSFVEMDGPQREQLLAIARNLFSEASSNANAVEDSIRRSEFSANERPNVAPVPENPENSAVK